MSTEYSPMAAWGGDQTAKNGNVLILPTSWGPDAGENSPLVDRLASKLGISDVHKDCKDKAGTLPAFSERHGLRLQEICFIGDDANDLPALSIVDLSACPADARPSIRES
jgi:3-deoxy-D-manno-octulosonate 8-phosphate phosphatase KdsC-like HAD superfamily phosphatase